MDERERMRQFLIELSPDEIIRFYEMVYRRPIWVEGDSMTEEAKNDLIEIILKWRDNLPLDWARARKYAGLDD